MCIQYDHDRCALEQECEGLYSPGGTQGNWCLSLSCDVQNGDALTMHCMAMGQTAAKRKTKTHNQVHKNIIIMQL